MAWYHTPGKDQDAVICTRVRFARNLEGYPFPARLDANGAREILNKVGGVLEQNGFGKTDFADISRTMAYALMEQHYVTPAFVKESLPHALYLNEPCNLSAMVCGKDHIHLQCILPGLSLRDAYTAAHKIEQLLDEKFELAYDETWGYLTQSPSDLGTALGLSTVLFLPMLAGTERIEALSDQLNRLGLHLQGMYGEGSAATGCLYLLSTRTSLGLSEEDILRKVESAVGHLLEKERALRQSVNDVDRETLTDHALRAEGILRYAHTMTSQELLELIAHVRLGIAMGVVSDMTIESLTALLIEAMPATLTLASPSPLNSDRERDRYRAEVVRDKLSAANT